MSKKQTRKSVSLSNAVYAAATKLAAERGVSISSLVETGLRLQGLEATEGRHYDPVHRTVVGNEAAQAAFRQAIRQGHAATQTVTATAAYVERRQREHEERALSNPCRAEYCRIVGVHPADDPRHSKKIAARSLG